MALLVAPQVEPVGREGLLDLLDRLLAEVRDRGELVLRLADEVADRLDADALQAVVRADAELELLDREVLHPVRERRLGGLGRGSGLAEALDLVHVGEDRKLPDEDVGALADRVAWLDRAVRRDVEAQLVVVGALPDAGGLDVVRDTPHRREDGVDRDHADRVLRPSVQLGRHVASAAADRDRHLQLAVVGEARDLELRVEDLEVCGRLDVAGGDDPGAALREPDLHLGRCAVQAADQVLELEDDVGDVLTHARKRGELVRDSLDLHRGDGGALQRGEQHAAQRVAERVAEAAIERLDHEDAALGLELLVDDAWNLELHQGRASGHSVSPFGWAWDARLLRVELDDQLLRDGRVDLVTLRPLEHLARQSFVVRLQPRCNRGGEVGRVAHDGLGGRPRRDRDDVVRTHLEARDVHPPAVHVEVAVADELPRLGARGGEGEPVHDIVEPGLEHAQQVLAGDAGAPRRLVVVVAELLLEQAVVAPRLLLLTQLEQVLALLDAPAAVLARRVAAALDRALLGQAALALEEELHALAAALLALRGPIASQLNPSPLPRPHAVVRLRGHVLDTQDLEPRRLERADRRLAARARALHEDLHLLEAVLHPLARAGVGCDLRGERGRLAGAFEPGRAGRLPRDHVPFLVGQGHDRVVERRLDVRLADRNVLADAAAGAPNGRRTTRRRQLLRLLPAADVLLRALARARVRLRALAV